MRYTCFRPSFSRMAQQDFVTLDRDAPPMIAEFFARQNNACIEAFRLRGGDAAETPRGSKDGGDINRSSFGGGGGVSTKVISFSHFVPRQELCPEKRLLWEPQLTKVNCGRCRDFVLLVFWCPVRLLVAAGYGTREGSRGGTMSSFVFSSLVDRDVAVWPSWSRQQHHQLVSRYTSPKSLAALLLRRLTPVFNASPPIR